MRRLSWRRLAAAVAVAVGLTAAGAVPASAQTTTHLHVTNQHVMRPAVADWWV